MTFLSKGKYKMGDGLSLSLSLSLSIYVCVCVYIYIYTHTYIQEEITTIQKKETKQAKPETQVSYVGRMA